MSHTVHITENGANFNLTFPEAVNELFADGFSQLLLGWPVSKVVFHTVRQTPVVGEPENRSVSHVLAVPTPVLLQLAQQVMGSLAQNRAVMEQGIRKVDDGFIAAIPSSPR
jgi:hypothetical protein